VKQAARVVRHFVLGPWPIHPGLLWTFLALLLAGAAWRLIGAQPLLPVASPLAQRVVVIVMFAILVPAVGVVPLIIYLRTRGRLSRNPIRSPEYLISLAAAAAVGALVIEPLLPTFPIMQQILGHPSFIETFSRAFIVVWLVSALIGTVYERIQRESDTARAALQTVVTQRRLLLESEERVRGQVAAYLHDRVQTDLVTIGLRIRAAVDLERAEMTREIDASLADLERVRADEVRSASRRLSPHLARVPFDIALRDLAAGYRPGMTINVSVADDAASRLRTGDSITVATGLYRICEQGLLNAAVHGHATECWIQLSLDSQGRFVLSLHDNGVGLPASPTPVGMGTTVISAWSQALDGAWSLESADVGARLTAVIPAG
jgi:signal transduction histidine kinase